MTAVVMIGLNLAVLIGMGIFFHRRIENRMKPDQLIRQLRDEVNGVIADLNQATDRNVSLIEDRLEALNKALAKADRAVRVLQREAGRGGETAWRYNDIVRKAPGAPPSPAGTADAGAGAGQGGHVGAGGDADANPRAGDATENAPARPEGSPGADRPAAPDAGGGKDPGEATDRGGGKDSGGASSASAGRNPSKKERILDLHRKGIAANIIAGRVGSTVGEVELVISLSEGTE